MEVFEDVTYKNDEEQFFDTQVRVDLTSQLALHYPLFSSIAQY